MLSGKAKREVSAGYTAIGRKTPSLRRTKQPPRLPNFPQSFDAAGASGVARRTRDATSLQYRQAPSAGRCPLQHLPRRLLHAVEPIRRSALSPPCVDIGPTGVAAGVALGQLFVVQAEEDEDGPLPGLGLRRSTARADGEKSQAHPYLWAHSRLNADRGGGRLGA